MSNHPLKETNNLNSKKPLTISDPASSTYPSSQIADKSRQKKRYEYPFSIDNNHSLDSIPIPLNKSTSSPSVHGMDSNSTLQLPSLEASNIDKHKHEHNTNQMQMEMEMNINPPLPPPKPEILSLRIPKKQREINIESHSQSHKIRVPKRRKRPKFKQSQNCAAASSLSSSSIATLHVPLTPPKASKLPMNPDNEPQNESSSTSESDHSDSLNGYHHSKSRSRSPSPSLSRSETPLKITFVDKRTNDKKDEEWNDIEAIWLKWNCDYVRQKKYEMYFTNVNETQCNHLPEHVSWSDTYQRFNRFNDYKTMNCEYLKCRSEDSMKQHWTNTAGAQQDNASRQLYCAEYNNNIDVSNAEWSNVDERTKWLYRRAVIYQQLLFKFINSKYYNGKSLGIRIMTHGKYLVTYSDLKILRFDSRLKAAQAWDYEVRSNHGIIIDSNLPLSVKQYLDLTHEIDEIWNSQNILSLKQKWSKLKLILVKEYMDDEYGIYPTLPGLLDKLVLIYEWKNEQTIAYKKATKLPSVIWNIIDLKQLQRYFDMNMEINPEFEHFMVCILELMLKTAEISCYGFTDHFVISGPPPPLDLKYDLFDVQFDLNELLTRVLKYYTLHPFYKETIFSISTIDITATTTFGPDNAMTLNDCQALTDSLLNIPLISAAFGDHECSPFNLSVISQKLKHNKYEDVASYLDDLKRIWDHAMMHYKVDHTSYKLAKKYKALCLKKFELFFEGLNSDRRRSKRLINQNGLYSIRTREEEQDDEDEDMTDMKDAPAPVPVPQEQIRDINMNFMCPRCHTFQGKNSRSLKTHLRYCNKNAVMQYLEQHNGTKANATSCECGFTSHVTKGLQSHQLTCELIKRRLNNQSIPIIPDQSKIRMWIATQWYTGTVIKHTPTSDAPNLYAIHFRSKGDDPLPYNLEKFNFRVLEKDKNEDTNKKKKHHKKRDKKKTNADKVSKKRKRKRKRKQKRNRNENAFFSDDYAEDLYAKKKRRKVNHENVNANANANANPNPYFIYLHDMSKFRHKLFCKQYDAFQSYVVPWLDETKLFIQQS